MSEFDDQIDKLMQGGMSIVPNLQIDGMVNIAVHHNGNYYCIDLTREQLKELIIDLERIVNDHSW